LIGPRPGHTAAACVGLLRGATDPGSLARPRPFNISSPLRAGASKARALMPKLPNGTPGKKPHLRSFSEISILQDAPSGGDFRSTVPPSS
jgi:hypothetical protein